MTTARGAEQSGPSPCFVGALGGVNPSHTSTGLVVGCASLHPPCDGAARSHRGGANQMKVSGFANRWVLSHVSLPTAPSAPPDYSHPMRKAVAAWVSAQGSGTADRSIGNPEGDRVACQVREQAVRGWRDLIVSTPVKLELTA